MNTRRLSKDRVQSWLPRLVFLLCLIQPFLDIAGYWQQTLGVSNTVTMVLRMLLLGGSVLLGFLLSDRKRYYFLTAGVLGLLTLGHYFACIQFPNGYTAMVTDLINLVRIYFLPMMTLCFITFLRANDQVFPAMIKGMVADLFVIAGVQLLSTLTGTDPHTYSVDETGILGWFLWTNSQSAILAMLAPVAICWALTRWEQKLLPVALVTALAEATLYVLAPRLAFASLVAAGLGMAFCLVLTNRRRWRQALIVTLVTCLFVAAIPLSPMYRRLNANEVRAEQTVERIKEMDIVIEVVTETQSADSTDGSQTAPAVVTRINLDEQNAAKLEALYRSQDLIWSMVDRFGRDKVFEIYNYTLDPSILANTRTMKIHFCELVMDESGPLSRFFGLNLAELTHHRLDKDGLDTVDNCDVENDLHGMYFLTGWVGLGLMLIFLLGFGIRALAAVLREPKRCFNLPMCAFAIAYGLGFIHAYFTASVLRRNNASIYLALVLAGLWYLSRRQADRNEAAL